MTHSRVLIFFHEAWRNASVIKRSVGQVVLKIDGTNLQIADTEDNLRTGPLKMMDPPDFKSILVEVFPKDNAGQGGFLGYGRAWLGPASICGFDVKVDGNGHLVPEFLPIFYRHAILVLGLSDEQISFMMDRIAEELITSVRELVAKNYPASVPT